MLTALSALIVAVGACRNGVNAQVPASPVAKEDLRAKIFEEMRQTASAFKAVSIEGETRTPVALVREPLHRWTDPTRETSDGSLWAWRTSGRPIAVMTIEFHSIKPETWSLEFISLSTGRVEASDDRTRWTPGKAGVSFHEIPDAPAPAVGEAERSRQMKDLLKRFSATEFWNVTREDYALRLLPHPIDRYADADSGLVDGAMFIFANGTNPEVVLVIEARRGTNGATRWSYAAAPLTTAAPTLRLDRKDVWTSPNKYGYLSRESYFFLERARNPHASSPPAKPS
jgi:hypothetical protein